MTDQTMRAAGSPQFSIGNVLGTSFSVLIRNIVPFAIISAIVSVPYILVTSLYGFDPVVVQAMLKQGQFPPGFFASGAVYLIAAVVTSSLISAALVYGTFQDLRGQKASVGDSLTRGFSALVPVLLAAVAYTILYIIGFILLIIPSIIVVVALWVYVPAIIVEKKGVGEAFTRSRELTKGRRWSIFGLLIVIAIIAWLLSWIVGFIFGIVLGTSGIVWAGAAARIIISAFGAVTVAVGYYYLRADKEGVAIGDIATVFD